MNNMFSCIFFGYQIYEEEEENGLVCFHLHSIRILYVYKDEEETIGNKKIKFDYWSRKLQITLLGIEYQ